MTIDQVSRASALSEELKRIRNAWSCLARPVVATVRIPTGSFDIVTGRDYTVDLSLAGQACIDLRAIIKAEYARVEYDLAVLGVVVPPLEPKVMENAK